MKRATWVYLASYLAVGGLGLLLAPDLALRLLLATGDYGDVMPRVVGMFMLVLSYLITSFIRRGDFSYYVATIVARTFIVIVLGALYLRSGDRLFLVLEAIVLIGLLPAIYLQVGGKGGPPSHGAAAA
jgi:uncharacterized protein YjeT (DUF2065 family)